MRGKTPGRPTCIRRSAHAPASPPRRPPDPGRAVRRRCGVRADHQGDVHPGQRHLHHGRPGDAGRAAARRLRAARRHRQGRARQGQGRGRPCDLRACRRHAVALADVGSRPRRAHHRAHQHDRARDLRAGQPRVRFRQGDLLPADERGEVPALRRQPAHAGRQAAAGLPRPRDHHARRRAHRAHRHHLRRHAAHLEPRRPAIPADRFHHRRSGRTSAQGRRRLRRGGDARRAQAGLRDVRDAQHRPDPDRARPRPVHQLRRTQCHGRVRATTRTTSPRST